MDMKKLSQGSSNPSSDIPSNTEGVQSSERKRGQLSNEEKTFIVENFEALSLSEIAEEVNRNEETVKRFLVNQGYLAKKTEEKKKEIRKINVGLREKSFFTRLSDQFTKDEIDSFIEQWQDIVDQFGGEIEATEELELSEFLTFEILKHRALKAAKDAREQKERSQNLLLKLEKEIRKLDPDDPGDELELKAKSKEAGLLKSDIQKYMNFDRDYTSDYKDAADKAEKTKKRILTARNERVKNLQNAKSNWVNLIKALQERDVREAIGRDMELAKIMKQKSNDRLAQPIVYEDGKVDIPILNADTVHAVMGIKEDNNSNLKN